MRKFWIQMAFLVLFILVSLYVASSNLVETLLPSPTQRFQQSSTQTPTIRQIKIDDNLLNVEVADTPQKRAQGLGGRETLADNGGMLFVFQDTKKHQFWMKGMKFPLDFIFIRDYRVVDLRSNIPPQGGERDVNLPIYEPIEPINMMLETKAEFIAAHNIKVGDKVFLPQ